MHIGITGPVSTQQLASLLNLPTGYVPAGMGGVPVNTLILELHKRGHQLSVFSNSYDVPAGETVVLRGSGIDIYYSPCRPRARHRLGDLYRTERRAVTKLIRQVRPDIMHAHWQYEWAWAALDSGVPTLVTCHDSPVDVLWSMRDMYRAVRLVVATWVLIRAKHLTAVSAHTAGRIGWFTKQPIRVIPNFEPDAVFALYRERKLSDSVSVVMVNNNFTKLKNVGVGLLAFQRLRRKYLKATLHLYGQDFGEGEAAQRWAVDNQCEQSVVFHGPLPFDALMEAMSSHDVFLHTSLQESFGMVLVEAMAMGIPVVAGADSGGVPWVLSDGAGVLTDITSPETVYNALDSLLSSPIQYSTMSRLARQQALIRFSANNVVNQYMQAYDQLCQTTKSTAHLV